LIEEMETTENEIAVRKVHFCAEFMRVGASIYLGLEEAR
jgi:hypothetical protein